MMLPELAVVDARAGHPVVRKSVAPNVLVAVPLHDSNGTVAHLESLVVLQGSVQGKQKLFCSIPCRHLHVVVESHLVRGGDEV